MTTVEVDEAMLVSAVRYALGRATYIVGTTCRQVRTSWPQLSPTARSVIREDIGSAIGEASRSGTTVGMDIDEHDWRDLLAWIDTQPA